MSGNSLRVGQDIGNQELGGKILLEIHEELESEADIPPEVCLNRDDFILHSLS
jgi:hypothetical protein